MIIRSKYSSKCRACGSRVEVGDPCEWTPGERGVKCARCADPNGRIAESKPEVRKLEADGTVIVPFMQDRSILRAAPGARWIQESKVWQWSVSDDDLPRTIECAQKLSLEVAPELLSRVAEGTENSRAAMARVAELEASAGVKLYDYQREGVKWLALRTLALLADDMGLGKTIQVLMALQPGERVLVVCPGGLKLNWKKEAEKWRPDFKVTVLFGRKAWKVPEAGEIVITNYDILPDTFEGLESGVLLVVDECQFVKNCTIKFVDGEWKAAGSARALRVKALREACGRAWFLTGTPMEARLTDLFGILDVLGCRALGNWKTFVRLCNGSKSRWGGWVFGLPVPEFAERLRRCMLRRTKAETLKDLPPKRRVDLWV